MRNRVVMIIVGVLACATGGASAQDLVDDSIPNKWIEPFVPEDLPAIEFPSYFTDLDQAKALVFRGRYKGALSQLRKVKKGDALSIALVKAEALAALGRHEEAIATLSTDGVNDQAKAQVARARILADTGKTADALALLGEHLKKNPDSLEGHFYLGQINEQIGDLDAARKAYEWFDTGAGGMRYLDKWRANKDKGFDNAAEVVLIGRAIDRLATLNGLYKDHRQLHDDILGMFVRAYDVIDREYWPAHVAAAEYFLSHDQQKEATEELQLALRANPNDERALELIGGIALDRFNFDGTDTAIGKMRRVNQASVRADILETRNYLGQRKAKEAEGVIRRVVEKAPKNTEALGLLAAANSLQLRDDKTAEILKQVDAIDPDNATAYYEVAEQLGAMRQYPRAAAMYQIAIDRAPWWTAARNGQGLLFTQSGDEDKALTVLDAAHTLDPFNLKTTNYLRLLDTLGKFARKETDHFIVMYDAKLDPVIPEYFSDYLESIHKEVAAQFQHEPAVKTLIEVFPTHEGFSVRTTGSPWIGTVGASTGRVIALVAPRKARATLGAFNWAQVLRHEYTHTVTLSATDNRITHWMTEGLAVQEEHSPLRWEWIPMLYNAVKKHQLFTMDGLTWGFIRPKRPIDRQLAYAQSFWTCQYIDQKYGHDAILRMMASFKAGKRQEDVIPEITGKSIKEFEKDFFEWAEAEVNLWGYDESTSKQYEMLKSKGESLIKSRQYADAVKVWEEIAIIRPVDAMPHARLAGLYLTKEVNRPGKAIDHLIALHKVELHDNRYAKRVARLYRDTSDWPNAMAYARQSVYIDPYDTDAHQLLLEIAEKANEPATAEREKRVIPIIEKWAKEQRASDRATTHEVAE